MFPKFILAVGCGNKTGGRVGGRHIATFFLTCSRSLFPHLPMGESNLSVMKDRRRRFSGNRPIGHSFRYFFDLLERAAGVPSCSTTFSRDL